MKRASAWIGAAAAVLAAGVALAAVKPGGKLFIKARDTRQYDKPNGTPLEKLQPGQEVVWNGAEKGTPWHWVTYKGKKGVVYQSALSPEKPKLELLAGQSSGTDPQAFASSGAGTKALGEAALNYAEAENTYDAPVQLMALEQLARQVKDTDVVAHAKKAGLAVAGEGKR